ncbi:MAG: L-threonylcarbamoyladenylate synthase [Bacteroidales bacterium]|nr:L-threonylcarbamoyladenylate synthase [Bacteroidales bacterium]MDY4174736.1 L-threonylcarbamoyladenylate synthase [Bacteroidales bacterium]
MDNTLYDDDLLQAVQTLRKGGVILYPTDTVWGLGCDATNPDAVAKVYAIKQRAESKSMLVLVDSPLRAQIYVRELSDTAFSMMELANKPLTLILDGAKNLASNLIADDGSVGIRVTSERFSHDLCYRFQKAVVSTSANISGQPAAAIFSEISQEIKAAVDYVVRYRQDDNKKSNPSSIVKLKSNGQVSIIRP